MLRQAKGVFGELWAGVINAVGTLIEVAATLKVTGTNFIVGANKFVVSSSTGTTGLYCNKGTAAACAFTAVTQA